jgi:hypothetical protein
MSRIAEKAVGIAAILSMIDGVGWRGAYPGGNRGKQQWIGAQAACGFLRLRRINE